MTEPETHLLPSATIADIPVHAPIVCATLRLAQTLSRMYDESSGQAPAWETLKATTLSQWLDKLFEALALRGQIPPSLKGLQVLDAFQEQLIWEKVIHPQIDTSIESLFDLRSLAANAAQAHKLSIEWNIQIVGANNGSEEQRQFRLWQSAFRSHCKQHGFIDLASLHAQLIDQISSIERILLPRYLTFAGFDHYTALEQRLQAQLCARGTVVTALAQSKDLGNISSIAPADIQEECLNIASWAQQQLAHNPHARLGIVAPDLEAYQRPLQDALEDMLVPEHIIARNARQPRPFNISLGQPLSNAPIVHCALTLLQLISTHQDIEQSRIATLLHSPYWSFASNTVESDARARLDAAFRISVALKAPLSRYNSFAAWYLDEHRLITPALRKHLQALAHGAKDIQKSQLPSEWRRNIEAILAKTGWLAEGKLNSIEFQIRQAFIEALNGLIRLDQITGKLSLKETVNRLVQLCNERLFQPKTQGNPSIQILGILESTGLTFDALWFAGLTEPNWPPAAHPNPLLSIDAQRQQQAPNSCASAQLDFAQRIQNRLLRSAPEIILSAPRMDGETELQPSALIAHYAINPFTQACNPPWLTKHTESMLEAIDDASAPTVESGAHVRGGTWLLRAQAICPAWGYYQYRLGAVPLQEPVEGLDARRRGTLVHDALEVFWKTTKDHSGLQSLLRHGLCDVINQSIDRVLDAYDADKKHEPLKSRQRILERNRLSRLLTKWLEVEGTRTEPFSVIHCEHEFQDNISGIEVRMFIDRIDQLSDGSLLIIDYKTGSSVDTRNWSSSRLTEPQLPIYAAIANPREGAVAGVAFAQVHLSKLIFKGIGDAENLLPGMEDLRSYRARRIFNADDFPDWNSVLTHWKNSIHMIADEICRGDASVRYAKDSDLIYCDVRPLLRLSERNRLLESHMEAGLLTETQA